MSLLSGGGGRNKRDVTLHRKTSLCNIMFVLKENDIISISVIIFS